MCPMMGSIAAAAQLAPDDTEDAALLARSEDAAGILRVVASVFQSLETSRCKLVVK
jgi:hypothetical protein